ncbi:MAG: hypothetical protein ACLSA0_23300 [Eisenbergiella massiliensis]
MKKKIISIFTALLWMVICTMLNAQTAFAAGEAGISIPVKISLSGTLPSQGGGLHSKAVCRTRVVSHAGRRREWGVLHGYHWRRQREFSNDNL